MISNEVSFALFPFPKRKSMVLTKGKRMQKTLNSKLGVSFQGTAKLVYAKLSASSLIKKREYITFSTMMAFNFLVSLPKISTMLFFFVYKAKKSHLLNHQTSLNEAMKQQYRHLGQFIINFIRMAGLVKKSEQALKIFFSWQQVLGFFFNNLVTRLKKCPLNLKLRQKHNSCLLRTRGTCIHIEIHQINNCDTFISNIYCSNPELDKHMFIIVYNLSVSACC